VTPGRFVSLCPSITESLVEMGLSGSLAGITRYCVRPREALAGIPRVGGTKDPDLARIRALAPDLVFCNAEENRRADVEALAAEFPVDLSHPRRAAEVPPLLRRWGAAAGRGVEGDALAAAIEQGLREAEERRGKPSFRFACLVWHDPWMAAGEGTYPADLLRLAGGAPALPPGRGDWVAVAPRELEAASPDVVLLPDEPFSFTAEHRAEVGSLLPRALVVDVPGEDWFWHGAGTRRGLSASSSLGELVKSAFGAETASLG
jgi:ABC-type Fe3+-hydroxamate transport system substrate-binding protein